MISKKEFNAKSILEQIELFNILLGRGLNITDCCRGCNIAYSTIRDRFKKHNFFYNRFTNKYENIEEIFPHEDRLIYKVIDEINKNNLIEREFEVKHTNRADLVNRSFSIDKNILDDFLYFCDTSKYKQYDILSQFIREGIEKYSK
jgi:hypothetical protein